MADPRYEAAQALMPCCINVCVMYTGFRWRLSNRHCTEATKASATRESTKLESCGGGGVFAAKIELGRDRAEKKNPKQTNKKQLHVPPVKEKSENISCEWSILV